MELHAKFEFTGSSCPFVVESTVLVKRAPTVRNVKVPGTTEARPKECTEKHPVISRPTPDWSSRNCETVGCQCTEMQKLLSSLRFTPSKVVSLVQNDCVGMKSCS